MFLQSRAMQCLKKKLTLIINDQRGSYVISFVFIFLVIFLLIVFSLQVGLMMIQGTQIQTATDAATLAAISTIKVNPVSTQPDVVFDDQGEISEINMESEEWEIDADETDAFWEGAVLYVYNTSFSSLDKLVMKGELLQQNESGEYKEIQQNPIIVGKGSPDLYYKYNLEVTDKRNPLMVWKPFFENGEIKYKMKSSSKSRIVIP